MYFSLFIFFTLALGTITVHGAIPDCSIVFDAWKTFHQSTTTTDCCGWNGVGCSDAAVISIDWSGRKLRGSIPAILSTLTHLQSLNLSNNQLIGTIPASLGNLIKSRNMYVQEILYNRTFKPGNPGLKVLKSSIHLEKRTMAGERVLLRIWDGPAPHSEGKDLPSASLPNPHHPSLEVFVPELMNVNNSPRPAMIVLPGGGYRFLSDHEYEPPSTWLAESGIVAFALRYRIGPEYQYPTQLDDVQRAVRYVRSQASRWNIDPHRIGILGFSAGGHLSSLASTHFTLGNQNASDPVERVSSRPDAQVLIYPVIDFVMSYAPCSALLGDADMPDRELLTNLSTHLSVTSETPPAFLVHGVKDQLVPIENSIKYARALQDKNVSVELLKADWGNHGFGMNEKWTTPCESWLKTQWNF